MTAPLPISVEIARAVLWHNATGSLAAPIEPWIEADALAVAGTVDARVRPLVEALQALRNEAGELQTPHIPRLDAAFAKADAALKAAGAE